MPITPEQSALMPGLPAFFWRVSRVVLVSFLYRMRLLD
jgi:hypothetical protein